MISNLINNLFNFYFECITPLSANSGLFLNDLNFFYFELYFLFSITVLLIFFVILSNKKNYLSKYLSVSDIFLNISFFVILILFLLLNSSSSDSYYLFSGFYFNDSSIIFFKNLLLLGFFLFLFSVKNYILKLKGYDFEFILILLISLFSSLLLLNSNDLVSLFFIIELQSLSFYILVASKQTSSFSTESGLKYFILGCFSSGIILFGISLIYGFTGLLAYDDLSLFVDSFYVNSKSSLDFPLHFPFLGLILGTLLLTIGFLFKFGAVPFHMWMPDVYEGAPMIITFYLSTIPKMALIFVMFKIYYCVIFPFFLFYQNLFLISALLSIILGSIAAIYQVKLKRLLTYSMITNTGYLLLSFAFGDVSGIYVTVFYLISYVLIMLGLFFCFISLRNRSNNLLIKRINMLANLIEINPYLAFSVFILLFSIAGVPPLLGFYSKFFLFLFSMKFKMYWLALLFVVFSVISVFYYIRLVKLMYFNRLSGWVFLHEIPFSNAFIIAFITLVNCLFFLNPNLLFKFIYNFSFALYL